MWKRTLRLATLICGLATVFSATGAEGRYEVAFYKAGLLNENGAGIDRDVVAEVQKRTGFHFTFSEKPRARIWGELKSGALDMSVSGIATAERDQFAWFIPYLVQRNMAVLRKEKAPQYRSLDEFVADPKARVGVVRGFVHGDKYDRALSILRQQGRVYEAPSIDMIFSLLKAENRIDAVFALPVFYQRKLAELSMADKVTILDWDREGEPIRHCLVLSKKRVAENDREAIRRTVAEMKADGTLRAIFARYLSGAELEAALNF